MKGMVASQHILAEGDMQELAEVGTPVVDNPEVAAPEVGTPEVGIPVEVQGR